MSDAKYPVITVDGPSGSGKGTLCQWLAQQLSWNLLDSGALYRLVALAAQRKQISLQDEAQLAELAEQLDVTFDTSGQEGVAVFLEGDEVSKNLRSEECAAAASQVAGLPAVRTALFARQQAFRSAPGLVADGRDMGTVVFTDAELKIYLTASAEERAKRRYNQLNSKGIGANLADLLQDIKARDERDTSRTTAPLKPAEDAHILDTTAMDISEVCDRVLQLAEKLGFSAS